MSKGGPVSVDLGKLSEELRQAQTNARAAARAEERAIAANTEAQATLVVAKQTFEAAARALLRS